jgi:hypothetical protein
VAESDSRIAGRSPASRAAANALRAPWGDEVLIVGDVTGAVVVVVVAGARPRRRIKIRPSMAWWRL